MSWWASFALAQVEDDITRLVHQGTVYSHGNGFRPSRYDQRHTLYLDFNYRPSRRWHFNMSWQSRSGWPHTAMKRAVYINGQGNPQYYMTNDTYNGANYPAYHRLDLRINRHFYTSKGRISAFLALINLFNRRNVANVNYHWDYNDSGNPRLTESHDYWFKLLPSVGISWSMNH